MPDDPKTLSGPLFVAVGDEGFRAFSRDGKEWTNRALGQDGQVMTNVIFGGGRCVAAGRYGGSNHFFATVDGAHWEHSEIDAKYSKFDRGIVYFRDRFYVPCGDGGNDANPFFVPSADGVHWDAPLPIPKEKDARDNPLLRRCAVGKDLLVAVGDFGRKSVTRDVITWKNTTNVKPVDTLIDITFGNGVFVGGGMHGLRMRSEDGLTWTDRVIGEEGEHINTILFDGKQFVGVGQGGTYFSPDGKAWTRAPNIDAPTTAAFGNGIYVGALWQGKLMRSTDAITWTNVESVPQNIESLAYGELGKA